MFGLSVVCPCLLCDVGKRVSWRRDVAQIVTFSSVVMEITKRVPVEKWQLRFGSLPGELLISMKKYNYTLIPPVFLVVRTTLISSFPL